MRTLTKVAFFVLAVPVGILAYFAPNIRGHYRFKEVCNAEGGLRVHQKLKRNVGWLVTGADPTWPLTLEHVAFTRGKNRFGKVTDYRYLGGHGPMWRNSEEPADLATSVAYEVRWINEQVPNELRLHKYGYEIRDITTGGILARWYQFNYGTFDQDRTILAAPSGVICHDRRQFSSPSTYERLFGE
jgi:hypothetical protein